MAELELKTSGSPLEWLLVLAFIGARRTHEPAFQQLFKKMLENKLDFNHKRAKDLEMRYDFTPLHPIAEGSTTNDNRVEISSTEDIDDQ